MEVSSLLWNVASVSAVPGAVTGTTVPPQTDETGSIGAQRAAGVPTPSGDGTSNQSVGEEGDDPIIEATVHYLQQVKASVYDEMSRQAVDISTRNP